MRRPARPWVTKHNKTTHTSATLNCKTQCNCNIPGSISWALKRPLQCAEQFLELKICFATVSRDRHTNSCERVHLPKHKCCVALQRRAFPNVTMCVSLQRRAQKCMNLSTMNRPASRKQKNEVLLQFWAIDTTFLTRGLRKSTSNLRFATVLGDWHDVFSERVARRQWNLRLTTVLGDRHHVFDERVATSKCKFASRYSFGRSTPRFWREGCATANEICVSLQFWAIDTTFLTRGLRASKWNLRFATVLGDR